MPNLIEAAKKTADFIELATPSGEVVARHINELAACDDPMAETERRMRLSVLIARLATAGALALALIEQHGLVLVNADYAAGELADAGISLRHAALGDPSAVFGFDDPHALILSLIEEAR